jgi:hypothetical protein
MEALVWIGPYSQVEDTQKALAGFSRSARITVLKRMRACADDVERLLTLGLSEPLLSPRPDPEFASNLSFLPHMLRLYADYVKDVSARSASHPRSHFTRNTSMFFLVCHVKGATGSYKDKEVSSLISAVLNRASYDDTAHKQWRYEHAKEILLTEQLFPVKKGHCTFIRADHFTPRMKR